MFWLGPTETHQPLLLMCIQSEQKRESWDLSCPYSSHPMFVLLSVCVCLYIEGVWGSGEPKLGCAK